MLIHTWRNHYSELLTCRPWCGEPSLKDTVRKMNTSHHLRTNPQDFCYNLFLTQSYSLVSKHPEGSSSPKNKTSVVIYSQSCCSKSVYDSFVFGTQKIFCEMCFCVHTIKFNGVQCCLVTNII